MFSVHSKFWIKFNKFINGRQRLFKCKEWWKVFTCSDSSKVEFVCCPVLESVVTVKLLLVLLQMDSPDSATPSRPTPARQRVEINIPLKITLKCFRY